METKNRDRTRRLIKQREMLDRYFGGISDSTAERRLYSRPDFPRPIKIFPGMNVRDEAEVAAFVEKLIQEDQRAVEA